MLASLIAPFFLVAQLHAADPLFESMQGSWRGNGTRVQLVSKRETRIEMQTESKVEGERLYTRNEVREVNDRGESKSYERRYWIRRVEAGHYELGADGNKVFAQATFKNAVLVVTQQLGGNPPYQVRSETRFETQDASDYGESLSYGSRILAHTRLRFRRLP